MTTEEQRITKLEDRCVGWWDGIGSCVQGTVSMVKWPALNSDILCDPQTSPLFPGDWWKYIGFSSLCGNRILHQCLWTSTHKCASYQERCHSSSNRKMIKPLGLQRYSRQELCSAAVDNEAAPVISQRFKRLQTQHTAVRFFIFSFENACVLSEDIRTRCL